MTLHLQARCVCRETRKSFHLLWPVSISSTQTVSFTISRKQKQSNVSVIFVFTLFRSAIPDCIVSKYWLDIFITVVNDPSVSWNEGIYGDTKTFKNMVKWLMNTLSGLFWWRRLSKFLSKTGNIPWPSGWVCTFLMLPQLQTLDSYCVKLISNDILQTCAHIFVSTGLGKSVDPPLR